MTNFKFKPGDVIVHKASGEKAIITEARDKEITKRSFWASKEYVQEAYYVFSPEILSFGIYSNFRCIRGDMAIIELVFDLYEEKNNLNNQ